MPALLTRAGLPESTFPAFRAALEAHDEIGFVATVGGATRLRRHMVERVLAMCEAAPADISQPLLILLRRFATESAREEARVFCDELVVEAARKPMSDEVLACEPAFRELEVREEFCESAPAMAFSSEADTGSLEENTSEQNAGAIHRFNEAVTNSRPRFLDRLALRTQRDEYEPDEAELDDTMSHGAIPYEAWSYESEPYESEPYESEPCNVASDEPERVEPRFDEPKNSPRAYREPLLSDLLAAA